MAHSARNVLLPMALPTQSSLRSAVRNIILDLQRDHSETDEDTADKLGVSEGTVANARNMKGDLKALTIAKIGAVYGADAIAPYNALYGATAHGIASQDAAPVGEVAEALARLCQDKGIGDRLNSLPALQAAAEKLAAYVVSLQQRRLA